MLAILDASMYNVVLIFVAQKPTNIEIALIPVGDSQEIPCDGKCGGSYHWKGHDFTITLPPDCANGMVTITLEAYLPVSRQDHCFVSAVFAVYANTKMLKKPVSIQFPHWVNIKSETDKEKLYFLITRDNHISHEVQKGSFEIGKPSGSIEIKISEICHVFICKKFPITFYTFVKAGRSSQSGQLMKIHSHNGTPILLDVEERSTTIAMNEAAEYNYLDMLLLPEYHDRKWGLYCIAIDNPTYLQVTLGYINMHMHIYTYIRIYSHVYIYVVHAQCTA